MSMALRSLELKAAAFSEFTNLKMDFLGTAEGVLIMEWICSMKGDRDGAGSDPIERVKCGVLYSPFVVRNKRTWLFVNLENVIGVCRRWCDCRCVISLP